ncbi:methyltransferase domain-containing protein [Candidatus Omnitrophota bacterium]
MRYLLHKLKLILVVSLLANQSAGVYPKPTVNTLRPPAMAKSVQGPQGGGPDAVAFGFTGGEHPKPEYADKIEEVDCGVFPYIEAARAAMVKLHQDGIYGIDYFVFMHRSDYERYRIKEQYRLGLGGLGVIPRVALRRGHIDIKNWDKVFKGKEDKPVQLYMDKVYFPGSTHPKYVVAKIVPVSDDGYELVPPNEWEDMLNPWKVVAKSSSAGAQPNELAHRVISDLGNPKDVKILSLGSGDFGDEIYFASQGCNVTAIEKKTKAKDIVSKHSGITPYWGDMLEILPKIAQSQKEKFDVVYARLSLHYLDRENLERVFELVKELLVPGGRFYFVVKSQKDPHYRRSVDQESIIEDPDTWLLTYVNPQLKELADAGDATVKPDVTRQFFDEVRVRHYTDKAKLQIETCELKSEQLKVAQKTGVTDAQASKILEVSVTKALLSRVDFNSIKVDVGGLLRDGKINIALFEKLLNDIIRLYLGKKFPDKNYDVRVQIVVSSRYLFQENGWCILDPDHDIDLLFMAKGPERSSYKERVLLTIEVVHFVSAICDYLDQSSWGTLLAKDINYTGIGFLLEEDGEGGSRWHYRILRNLILCRYESSDNFKIAKVYIQMLYYFGQRSTYMNYKDRYLQVRNDEAALSRLVADLKGDEEVSELLEKVLSADPGNDFNGLLDIMKTNVPWLLEGLDSPEDGLVGEKASSAGDIGADTILEYRQLLNEEGRARKGGMQSVQRTKTTSSVQLRRMGGPSLRSSGTAEPYPSGTIGAVAIAEIRQLLNSVDGKRVRRKHITPRVEAILLTVKRGEMSLFAEKQAAKIARLKKLPDKLDMLIFLSNVKEKKKAYCFKGSHIALILQSSREQNEIEKIIASLKKFGIKGTHIASILKSSREQDEIEKLIVSLKKLGITEGAHITPILQSSRKQDKIEKLIASLKNQGIREGAHIALILQSSRKQDEIEKLITFLKAQDIREDAHIARILQSSRKQDEIEKLIAYLKNQDIREITHIARILQSSREEDEIEKLIVSLKKLGITEGAHITPILQSSRKQDEIEKLIAYLKNQDIREGAHIALILQSSRKQDEIEKLISSLKDIGIREAAHIAPILHSSRKQNEIEKLIAYLKNQGIREGAIASILQSSRKQDEIEKIIPSLKNQGIREGTHIARILQSSRKQDEIEKLIVSLKKLGIREVAHMVPILQSSRKQDEIEELIVSIRAHGIREGIHIALILQSARKQHEIEKLITTLKDLGVAEGYHIAIILSSSRKQSEIKKLITSLKDLGIREGYHIALILNSSRKQDEIETLIASLDKLGITEGTYIALILQSSRKQGEIEELIASLKIHGIREGAHIAPILNSSRKQDEIEKLIASLKKLGITEGTHIALILHSSRKQNEIEEYSAKLLDLRASHKDFAVSNKDIVRFIINIDAMRQGFDSMLEYKLGLPESKKKLSDNEKDYVRFRMLLRNVPSRVLYSLLDIYITDPKRREELRKQIGLKIEEDKQSLKSILKRLSDNAQADWQDEDYDDLGYLLFSLDEKIRSAVADKLVAAHFKELSNRFPKDDEQSAAMETLMYVGAHFNIYRNQLRDTYPAASFRAYLYTSLRYVKIKLYYKNQPESLNGLRHEIEAFCIPYKDIFGRLPSNHEITVEFIRRGWLQEAIEMVLGINNIISLDAFSARKKETWDEHLVVRKPIDAIGAMPASVFTAELAGKPSSAGLDFSSIEVDVDGVTPAKAKERLKEIMLSSNIEVSSLPRSEAVICLAGYCNLNCRSCLGDSRKLPEDASMIDHSRCPSHDKTENIIRFLNETDIDSLIFTGDGEPLLNDATLDTLCEIIARTKACTVSIWTNCLWALDKKRAEYVLNRIKSAIEGRDRKNRIKSFYITASVDEFHAPNIAGVANLINIFVKNQERLIDLDEINQGLHLQTVLWKNTRKTYEALNAQMCAEQDFFAEFDLKPIDKILEMDPEKWRSQTRQTEHLSLNIDKDRRIEIPVGFLTLVYIGRAQQQISIDERFAVRIYDHSEGDDTVGLSRHPLLPEMLCLKTYIHHDGKVFLKLFNMNMDKANALSEGTICIPFEELERREAINPIIAAFRKRGPNYMRAHLRDIDPELVENFNKYELPEINIVRLIQDDGLYVLLSIRIIKDLYWDRLTDSARQEIESLERAVEEHRAKPSSAGLDFSSIEVDVDKMLRDGKVNIALLEELLSDIARLYLHTEMPDSAADIKVQIVGSSRYLFEENGWCLLEYYYDFDLLFLSKTTEAWFLPECVSAIHDYLNQSGWGASLSRRIDSADVRFVLEQYNEIDLYNHFDFIRNMIQCRYSSSDNDEAIKTHLQMLYYFGERMTYTEYKGRYLRNHHDASELSKLVADLRRNKEAAELLRRVLSADADNDYNGLLDIMKTNAPWLLKGLNLPAEDREAEKASSAGRADSAEPKWLANQPCKNIIWEGLRSGEIVEPELREIKEAVRGKIIEVGKHLRENHAEMIEADEKLDGSPVTKGDLYSQANLLPIFMEHIKRTRLVFEEKIGDPSLALAVGEQNENFSVSAWTTVLDPIDGSDQFKSLGQDVGYGTEWSRIWMIGFALYYKGVPVMTIGYSPEYDIEGAPKIEDMPGSLFEAMLFDEATTLNGMALQVASIDDLKSARIALETVRRKDSRDRGWPWIQPNWREELASYINMDNVGEDMQSTWFDGARVAASGTFSSLKFPHLLVFGGQKAVDAGAHYFIAKAGGICLNHKGEEAFPILPEVLSDPSGLTESFVSGHPSAVYAWLDAYRKSISKPSSAGLDFSSIEVEPKELIKDGKINIALFEKLLSDIAMLYVKKEIPKSGAEVSVKVVGSSRYLFEYDGWCLLEPKHDIEIFFVVKNSKRVDLSQIWVDLSAAIDGYFSQPEWEAYFTPFIEFANIMGDRFSEKDVLVFHLVAIQDFLKCYNNLELDATDKNIIKIVKNYIQLLYYFGTTEQRKKYEDYRKKFFHAWGKPSQMWELAHKMRRDPYIKQLSGRVLNSSLDDSHYDSLLRQMKINAPWLVQGLGLPDEAAAAPKASSAGLDFNSIEVDPEALIKDGKINITLFEKLLSDIVRLYMTEMASTGNFDIRPQIVGSSRYLFEEDGWCLLEPDHDFDLLFIVKTPEKLGQTEETALTQQMIQSMVTIREYLDQSGWGAFLIESIEYAGVRILSEQYSERDILRIHFHTARNIIEHRYDSRHSDKAIKAYLQMLYYFGRHTTYTRYRRRYLQVYDDAKGLSRLVADMRRNREVKELLEKVKNACLDNDFNGLLDTMKTNAPWLVEYLDLPEEGAAVAVTQTVESRLPLAEHAELRKAYQAISAAA